MKAKTLLLITFSLLVGLFISCQSDELETNELRAFEQDLNTMYHFVCIDRQNISYYLAFGEDNDHIKLIPEDVISDLNRISDLSLEQFSNELENLNSLLQLDYDDCDFIVLSTLYDEYELDVKNDIPVNRAKDASMDKDMNDNLSIQTRSSGYQLGHVPFNKSGYTPSKTNFKGKDIVTTETRINTTNGGTFIYAELICESGYCTASEDPDNVNRTKRVISKTSSYYSTTDSWKNTKGTGNSVTWTFYGILKNQNQMADCRVYEVGDPYSNIRTISLRWNDGRGYVTSDHDKIKLVFDAGNYIKNQQFLQELTITEEATYLKHFGLIWTGRGWEDRIVLVTDKNAKIDYTLKVNPNSKIYLKKEIRGDFKPVILFPFDPSEFYDHEFGEPLDCSLVISNN